MAKAPQAIFEALPRFGASLFASIVVAPVERKGDAGQAGAAPARSEAQPTGNMPVPPGYVIGPGDTLALSVWSRNIEQVKQTLTVTPEGFIVLPQIGRVTAAGQTLEQLRQSLTMSFGRFFTTPAVNLVVSEQRVVDVYVTGDAVRPGKYSLAGMATVLSALYAAQGPSDIGSFRTVRLNRTGQAPMDIDLYDYLLTGARDKDIVLAPGDSLFIPTVRGEVGLAGEVRRPARYEMKEGLTVAQAIELAGGMKPSAYTPVVHLWRANARLRWELTTINCSDKQGADMRQPLHDGDLLIVKSILNTGDNTVQLMGAVKRPGYYPCVEGSTVSSLLRSAEGLAWNAHMATGILRRMDYDRHYFIITFNVSEQMYGDKPLQIPLQSKDEVEILAQSDVEPTPEVKIEGAVAKPGTYQWAGNLKVSQLVLLSGSLLPEAYVERADLLRLTADQKYEIISVNLKAALAGDLDKDLLLKRGDILKITKIGDALPAPQVNIAGYVRKPGAFTRREGMKVSDLVFAAGGLKPGAGPQVEVTPGRFEGAPKTVALQLTGTPENYCLQPDMVLGDGDTVSIKGRGEFKEQADVVFLQGRVQSPGSFTLKRAGGRGYTICELLGDSGGLLADANPDGIVIYRKREVSLGTAQNEDLTRILQSVNRESVQPAPQLDQNTQAAAYGNTVAQGISTLVSPSSTAIILPPRPVRPEDWVTAIPVSGARLLASNGASGNIELEPGDNVVVPRRLNTVTILGAVPRSGAVPFVADAKCSEYIKEAGGLREDAADDRMVVIHPNGATEPIRMAMQVQPGDIIVVPTKHIVRTVRTESTFDQWMRGIIGVITGALLF
jgi:polysaccharide biosynthesis/export protein